MLIQIQVGEYRPTFVFDRGANEVRRGDRVIIELDRGTDHGRMVADTIPAKGPDGRSFSVQGKVLRKMTDGDLRQIDNNRGKAREALHVAISKVTELKLDMNMLTGEYSFDASKLILYFTAEGRVDFRELVKELAKVFRVRIELKQIGVRDRAKMITGYGVCGQPLCCATFIKDFSQLSIKMAKEQALPLNPSKISGVCGRIKCCMAYEVNVYKELNKGLPKMGAKIQVGEGRGRVINLDVLKRLVYVDVGEGNIVKVHLPENATARDLEAAVREQAPPPRPERRPPPERPQQDRRVQDRRPERANETRTVQEQQARPDARRSGDRPRHADDRRRDQRSNRPNDQQRRER